MDDVKNALGSLLVDEPTFELRGADVVSAASRQRRHRFGWVVAVAAAAAGVIALATAPQLHHAEPTGSLPACAPSWLGFPDASAARLELRRLRGLRTGQAVCRLLSPGTHTQGGPSAMYAGGSSFGIADGVTMYDDSYKVGLSYERDGRRDDVSLTISVGVRRPADTCPTGSTCRSGPDGSYAYVAHLDNGNLLLRAFQPDGTLIIGTVTPAVVDGSLLATDDDLYAVLGDPRMSIRAPIPGTLSRQTTCGEPASPTAAAICAAMPGNWRQAVITESSPTSFELTYLDDAGIEDVQLQIGSEVAQSAFGGCIRGCQTRQISVDGAVVARVEGDSARLLREQATVGPVSGRAFGMSVSDGKHNEVAVGRLLLAGIRAFAPASAGG